jgi:hypothetical protein
LSGADKGRDNLITCINLLERFRITWDPAYDAKGRHRHNLDPWMMQIPCRGGITIYPHGGSDLAVEVDYHRPPTRALAALPGLNRGRDRSVSLLTFKTQKTVWC